MDARRSQSSTDGRRRRLLHSHDTEELLAEFEALAPGAAPAVACEVTVAVPDRQLLTRMVSSQLWKHGLLILGIALLGATAIWGEIYKPDTLRDLADSRQPRVSKGLAGAFLIVSGQFALLIAWIRSRSSVDFSGRYRCWKWLAGCLISIGALWVTNFQNSLPQLARLFIEPVIGGVGAARHTLVVVPLAALSVWVLSRVVPDMGRSRWTQALFCLGVFTALGRLLLSYGTSMSEVSDAELDGVLLLATGLLVCSLLLHTRFVLYISKDPPERSAGGSTRTSAFSRFLTARKIRSQTVDAAVANDSQVNGSRLSESDENDAESPVIVAVGDQESSSAASSKGKKVNRRRGKSQPRRAA